MNNSLPIYVIYENPSDFPGEFVVRRRWHIITGIIQSGELLGRTKSLTEARNLLPPGLTCLQRHSTDDPVIVESWI
jgi:hypothetical protein